jgi:DNA polymerase-3 subunit epsilon
VNNKHRDLHGALIDAELLAQVYLRMTGGQAQLFGAEKADTHESSTSLQQEKLQRSVHSLKVIAANADELSTHEMLLDKIAKNGKCVWRESIKSKE